MPKYNSVAAILGLYVDKVTCTLHVTFFALETFNFLFGQP